MRIRLADIARLAAILAISLAAALWLPHVKGPSSSTSIFNLMTAFAFLIAFFINRALGRRRAVWNSIEVELSRLRRLWNIGMQISDEIWKKLFVDALRSYHAQVAENVLSYPDTLEGYRAVCGSVYDFRPSTPRDERLWQDLLLSTRDIALERRPLERALVTRLAPYSWAVMLFAAATVVALLFINRGQPGLTDLSVGLTVATVLVLLDLLRSMDTFSSRDIERFQKLYRDNLPEKTADPGRGSGETE